MSKCQICKEEKGPMLCCSSGIFCSDCARMIMSAQYQPMTSFNSILWALAETFFRKGKGEDTTFEQVWKDGDNLKLVKFEELWDKR